MPQGTFSYGIWTRTDQYIWLWCYRDFTWSKIQRSMPALILSLFVVESGVFIGYWLWLYLCCKSFVCAIQVILFLVYCAVGFECFCSVNPIEMLVNEQCLSLYAAGVKCVCMCSVNSVSGGQCSQSDPDNGQHNLMVRGKVWGSIQNGNPSNSSGDNSGWTNCHSLRHTGTKHRHRKKLGRKNAPNCKVCFEHRVCSCIKT